METYWSILLHVVNIDSDIAHIALYNILKLIELAKVLRAGASPLFCHAINF